MPRNSNVQLYFVLGLIATIFAGAALFYGTIGVIVLHFVHKYW